MPSLLLLAIAVQAHAFSELFDSSMQIPAHPYYQNQYRPTCNYAFGGGRISVTVETSEGDKSSCTFSHTERRQTPPESTSFLTAIYMQHFTCTDGASALYTTDWRGMNFVFFYQPDSTQPSIRCD
jgi:hypothetical protein